MAFDAGDRIGPYEVRARIGSGGMGEVYRARDSRLERDIAVKILPAEYAGDPEHLRRFEHEARAASALNHPNIITIHAIGTEGSRGYIAMELVDGENLRSIAAQGDLNLKGALRIACKIAEGLAAAHERGIVHRDLKPENVMISTDGFVKILDFGLAKLSQPVSSTDVTIEATSPGLIFGTVAYMSPEQASGRRTDFRSDQFSFGAMVYELLARRHPFQRSSIAETLAAILREEPPPLHELDSSIPAELGRIVSRCLAKEMGDRYGSTRDLARDLREVRDSLTRPGLSSDRIRSLPVAGRVRHMRPIVASLLAAATAAAILVPMALRSRHAAPAASATRTLMVAPFHDELGTPDSRMLVDGLTAAISNRLALARGLRVVSPSEDVEFTPESVDAHARSRGVDLVLKGDVAHEGDRLKVAYRIVEAKTGSELADESISGTSADLFTFEKRIAGTVFDALSIPRGDVVAEGDLSGSDQQKLIEAMGLLHSTGDQTSVDAAIERLESLLTNARDSAMVNGLLGRAYLFSYRASRKPALLEQARLYSERAVALDAALPDAQVTLGELYLTVGRNADAEAAFHRALKLRDGHPGALLGLADTYDALGRAAQAERYYERVLSLVPGWPTAYSRYGRFCFSRGHYEKAVEVFAAMTRLVPDSPRPITNLGAAYHALGRYDDAIRAYERAIALRPTPTGWSNLGTCQYALGRFDDSSRSFEEAVKLSPDNYLLWANAADALRWSEKGKERAPAAYQRAVAIARRDMELNPSDALLRAVTGSSLAKLGRNAEARKQIDAALRINPTDANVLYHAAVATLLRGDPDGALLWLRRALEAGYVLADARRDPEIASLRARKDFEELLGRSEAGVQKKESR
jgi:tetratricopeptide (TPR) repeat protein/TolB-like protein